MRRLHLATRHESTETPPILYRIYLAKLDVAPGAMLFYSWRGEHDAQIAAEAKIKADEQQAQVLQRNITRNNQAIAQLQEQQNARDAAAKQIATLSTLVSRHIYMTSNTDPENLSVAVVSEVRLLDLKPLEVGSGEGDLAKALGVYSAQANNPRARSALTNGLDAHRLA